ncbi:MAG: hypothetical protein QOF61_612 [Acidobacteriota bacterium]|nr:hypothetical protein [Acidobacteriota bacterium]
MARRADAAALAVLPLFCLAFFGRTLFAGKFLVAGDAYYYSYPLRAVAWSMIRGGELPLWTPHVLAGYPLASMSQLGFGYPPTWGYLLLPARLAEELYVLLPFLLAPAFTYAYARETGRSRLGALLAGLAFTYGGMMTGRLGAPGLLTNGVMWLPVFLIAVERARTRRFVPCLLGATTAYAMSVLNGHGQSFTYVGLLAAAYALVEPIGAIRDTRHEGWHALKAWRRWRPLAVALGAILCGAGVAAYQILETLRAARRSVRAALAYEVFSDGAFTPFEALRSLVAPPYHLIEVTTYVAPVALALAIVGACVAWRSRDARTVFWIVVAVLSFLLMLGTATPLNWIVYHLPALNRFRYPSRHAFEWSFAVALLAARGFDALASARQVGADDARDVPATSLWSRLLHSRANRLAVGWVLVVACALVGLLWWHDAMRRASPPLTGLDMGLIPAQPESLYLAWKLAFTLLAALALLAGLAAACRAKLDGDGGGTSRARGVLLACAIALACFFEPYLLCSYIWFPFAKSAAQFDEAPTATRLLQSFTPEQNRVYTRVNLFVVGYPQRPPLDLPNVTAVRGLQNVAGYEQLILDRFSRALGNVGPDAVNPRNGAGSAPDLSIFAPGSHVLDLLNTTHVVTYANLATAYTPAAGDGGATTNESSASQATAAGLNAARWRLTYDRDGVWVFDNLRAQPRAWLVGEAVSVDGEEALRRIRGEHSEDAPFDPRRTALVEDAPKDLPQLAGGELSAHTSARIVAYEPNRLTVETEADRDALLVVSEIFYPGWEASVDGRAARIHLTDYLLRGVAVPAGRHRVEMRYRAPAARAGASVSALTLALLVALGVYARRTRTSRVL